MGGNGQCKCCCLSLAVPVAVRELGCCLCWRAGGGAVPTMIHVPADLPPAVLRTCLQAACSGRAPMPTAASSLNTSPSWVDMRPVWLAP